MAAAADELALCEVLEAACADQGLDAAAELEIATALSGIHCGRMSWLQGWGDACLMATPPAPADMARLRTRIVTEGNGAIADDNVLRALVLSLVRRAAALYNNNSAAAAIIATVASEDILVVTVDWLELVFGTDSGVVDDDHDHQIYAETYFLVYL